MFFYCAYISLIFSKNRATEQYFGICSFNSGSALTKLLKRSRCTRSLCFSHHTWLSGCFPTHLVGHWPERGGGIHRYLTGRDVPDRSGGFRFVHANWHGLLFKRALSSVTDVGCLLKEPCRLQLTWAVVKKSLVVCNWRGRLVKRALSSATDMGCC